MLQICILKTSETKQLSTNNNKSKSYLALTATSIIWGTTWVASRIGVQYTPGLQVSYIRQFLAGIILLSFYFIKGEKLRTWSVKYIPSGLAALISALYPLCVVIINIIFFRQHKNRLLTFVGLIIGLAGVAVVFYENTFHEQPDNYLFGIVLGLVAMVAWSIGTIFVARNKYKINPYYAMGWQMFISSFLIYGMARMTNNEISFSDIPFQTWAAIAYLIGMGSVIAFIAFIYSIKYLPPAVASLFAYINPIVAMITGAILLDEPLTLSLILGAFITLIGVYLVNYSIKIR